MNRLENLFNRNRIKESKVKDVFYREIMNEIFVLCFNAIKDDNIKYNLRDSLRKSQNQYAENIIYKNFINQITSLNLNDEDYSYIITLLKASFNRLDQLISLSDAEKEKILINQNNKCAFCGKKISSLHDDCHIDHVIPFSYTGDELNDNYQVLCSSCNEKKGNKVSFLTQLIAKGNIHSLK